jgi:hypothetical protein
MFKLYHSKGVVNNSFVSDIPAGTELDGAAEQINGKVVTIAAGVLANCDSGSSVAGILAMNGTAPSYGLDEAGNDIGSVVLGSNENPIFMPVTRDMLIEVDTTAAAAVTIGGLYDIHTDFLTLNLAASTNDDFKVLKITEGTASAATKVVGVFTDPTGYFA